MTATRENYIPTHKEKTLCYLSVTHLSLIPFFPPVPSLETAATAAGLPGRTQSVEVEKKEGEGEGGLQVWEEGREELVPPLEGVPAVAMAVGGHPREVGGDLIMEKWGDTNEEKLLRIM